MMIADRYGTWRGMARLWLTRLELLVGQGGQAPADPAQVRRLVFVCHGNICRSAFADVAARQAGLHSMSIGLSTRSGKPAHPPAVVAAAHLGIDMTAHRSTAIEDYVPMDGDLLLAMETRHMRRMGGDVRVADVPRELLGAYTVPTVPHVHDPYQLGTAYMELCLKRIATAIPVLAARFPLTRGDGSSR